jgi:hypothetical protein
MERQSHTELPEQLTLINTEKYFEPLNPEIVWGHEYLMPSVSGRDMSGELILEGTYLPRDWENNLENIKNFSRDRYQSFISTVAKNFGISHPVELSMDKQNILREVVVDNGNKEKPTLTLDERCINSQKGQYIFRNVTHTKEAMLFLYASSHYLGVFDSENKYPYIEGDPGAYGPIDLVVPKELHGKENFYMHKDNQSQFLIKANNIVGKFGLDKCLLDFDDKGFIWHIEVYPGVNGTYFSRGKNSTEKDSFFAHNVDYSAQALAMLSVFATHINSLLPYR